MKVGIAIFPSKKLQDLANSYRKRYDSKYMFIPPHLTLKYAFEVKDDEINNISQDLSKLAKNHEPFTLRTLKVSSFHPVNNVIYFKVDPVPELIKLHEEINALPYGSPPEYVFVPHITIGQDLSDSEHDDVYGQLRLTKVEHEETVDRFHLLYQLDNGVWTVYDTYLLRKK